jgi:3-oxoadipate enol-lactonase
MPSARNGSSDVFFEIRGAGPPVILFNHSGASNLGWSDRFLVAMAEAFRIITPDQRGTGLSSPATDEFSLKDLATDGAVVLDALGIARTIVVGTSMGGAVAQEFALNYPERVSALLLLGTFAGGKHFVPPHPDVMALFDQASRIDSTLERSRRMLPTLYTSAFLARHEELALELHLKGSRYTTEQTMKRHRQAVSQFEAYARLPALSLPAMIIHGTADSIIPIENGRILASRIADSEFVPLEGIGHLPATEAPLETARLIRDFAAKSVGG